MKSCSPSLLPIAAPAWTLLSLDWTLSQRRTWIPFIYLLSVQGEGLDKILLFMSIFLERKALTMQLALRSNDIKIYCGWRVTFKATQPSITLLISNYYYFRVFSLLIFVYSYDFDVLIKMV